ncbi:TPA: hypothetical protein OEJ47_004261 [Escherichia coli]|nr:hypothetical protein [Escherichia coli]
MMKFLRFAMMVLITTSPYAGAITLTEGKPWFKNIWGLMVTSESLVGSENTKQYIINGTDFECGSNSYTIPIGSSKATKGECTGGTYSLQGDIQVPFYLNANKMPPGDGVHNSNIVCTTSHSMGNTGKYESSIEELDKGDVSLTIPELGIYDKGCGDAITLDSTLMDFYKKYMAVLHVKKPITIFAQQGGTYGLWSTDYGLAPYSHDFTIRFFGSGQKVSTKLTVTPREIRLSGPVGERLETELQGEITVSASSEPVITWSIESLHTDGETSVYVNDKLLDVGKHQIQNDGTTLKIGLERKSAGDVVVPLTIYAELT